jgi:hypothetical protein
MCDTIVKMQLEVKVYSFKLESSGVQQEDIVLDRVKYHSVRRWRGLCRHLHQMSMNKGMPLQEDWRFSRFLAPRTSGQLLQKAQVLIQIIAFR